MDGVARPAGESEMLRLGGAAARARGPRRGRLDASAPPIGARMGGRGQPKIGAPRKPAIAFTNKAPRRRGNFMRRLNDARLLERDKALKRVAPHAFFCEYVAPRVGNPTHAGRSERRAHLAVCRPVWFATLFGSRPCLVRDLFRPGPEIPNALHSSLSLAPPGLTKRAAAGESA
jgi:hypothetical protein